MKKLFMIVAVLGGLMFGMANDANATGLFGLNLNFGRSRNAVRIQQQQQNHHNNRAIVELRSPIRVRLPEPQRVRRVERIEVEKVQVKEIQRVVRDQYGREFIVVEKVQVHH